MLFDQDARRQRLRRVIVSHGNRRLRDDRAAVEFTRDEMHGDARDLDAVRPGLALRVDARERRQQRWMDVENGVLEFVEERPAEKTHEAREAHQRHAAAA